MTTPPAPPTTRCCSCCRSDVVVVAETASPVAVAASAGRHISSDFTVAAHLASTAVAGAGIDGTRAAAAGAGAAASEEGTPPTPGAATAAEEGAVVVATAAAAAEACRAWATLRSRSRRSGPGRSSGVQIRQVFGSGHRTRWLRRLLHGRHHRCSHGSPLAV